MAEECDLLDTLLQVANELEEPAKEKPKLTELDLFGAGTEDIVPDDEPTKSKKSLIHNGDTDSSDDEDNKYYEERKYNEYGRNIKQLLPSASSSSESIASTTWKSKPMLTLEAPKATPKAQDVYCDPIFGLRIINPLISSQILQERMVGRENVPFSKLSRFINERNISNQNWVLAGVIATKSTVRTSQKGNQFLIWTLTDLKDDIKTASMFLFRSAYKELWKTATGTVVAILNPSVMDKRDGSKDEACLSVDNFQKVMILGQSKDLGNCKSTRKDGQQRTAIVNKSRCEFCVYHIRQEYQKCSKRSELQANFAGQGLTALRNKVLGKNEVFYAGKSYTAIPAKKNTKLQTKEKGILKSLDGMTLPSLSATKRANPARKKAAVALDVSRGQRLRDIELLEKLNGPKQIFDAEHSSKVTVESSKAVVGNILTKLKAKKQDNVQLSPPKPQPEVAKPSRPIDVDTPILRAPTKGTIDLNGPITSRQVQRAKMNALKFIQKNGQIKKVDPNRCKGNGTKRCNDENLLGNEAKKSKIENDFMSDRFKKMLEATSKHSNLLKQHDDEEQEKYFNKLEMKEKMEEKMANTYKVPCKAVKCTVCKYTSFSAAQKCKDEKHQLKVFDAVKRFFKCGDCGNRTVSLEIIPVKPCKNCGSGKWERAGMMKEKVAQVQHELSIRGGEQTFVNSVATNANLNLLVPEN